MNFVITLVLFFLISFSQTVNAENTTPAKSGQVLCSITAPRTTGFTLIPFFKKDKNYSGTQVIENLEFIGKINPMDRRFDVKVNTLDAEGEILKSVFEASALLVTGEFFRFKILQQDSETIEVYCYLMDY